MILFVITLEQKIVLQTIWRRVVGNVLNNIYSSFKSFPNFAFALKFVVWIYNTFDDYFRIGNEFTKHLKESCSYNVLNYISPSNIFQTLLLFERFYQNCQICIFSLWVFVNHFCGVWLISHSSLLTILIEPTQQCLSQDLETGCLKWASKFLRGITIYSYFNHKHV